MEPLASKIRPQSLLEKLKLPIVIVIIAVSLSMIWKVFDLPSEEVLIGIAEGYFKEYGLLTVFIASLVEGMLLIGWYLPGSVVIFLGVILSYGDPARATLSVIVTIFGLGLAYTFNYFIGKYGWYKVFKALGLSNSLDKAQDTYKKYHNTSIYFSYWQPNLASLISSAAGILQAPFVPFLIHSWVASVLWLSFWGVITFMFGKVILDYLGPIFLLFLICWIGYIVYQNNKDPQS
jgi:membrane protein DedA with SNARE-associated domain